MAFFQHQTDFSFRCISSLCCLEKVASATFVSNLGSHVIALKYHVDHWLIRCVMYTSCTFSKTESADKFY